MTTDPRPVAWLKRLANGEPASAVIRHPGLEPAEPLVLAAELVEAQAERDRLARWKAEALPVMSGLQDLGKALGLRLGVNITGQAAAEEASRLRAEVTDLRRLLSEAEHKAEGCAARLRAQGLSGLS